jgi:hypothetical protein
MEINDADVAELVDARDLKPCGPADNAHTSCKTEAGAPIESDGDPGHLQNTPALHVGWQSLEDLGRRLLDPAKLDERTEIDRRLHEALYDAGRSALGMPGTVDTFKAMLAQVGLVLVLA